MGSDFYYFCSQLPGLVFGGEPPLTPEEFFEQVDRLLTEREAGYLRRCTLPPSREAEFPENSLYGRFRDWHFALIGELARFRAAEHSGKEIAPVELPPETDGFAYVREEILNASRAIDPLERERQFDLIRWRKLEDLAVGRNFTLDGVTAYLLKLGIMEKHSRFSAAAGAANFEEAVKEIDRRSEA